MLFQGLLRIVRFGKSVPYAFTAASPACRIAAERFCKEGYTLKDNEGRTHYLSFIGPPDRTKEETEVEEERYLTVSNTRKVSLMSRSEDGLHRLYKLSSWWLQQKFFALPLRLEMWIVYRMAPVVNAVDIVSADRSRSLVVSLKTRGAACLRNIEKLSNLESLYFNANDELVDFVVLATGCPKLRDLEVFRCEIQNVASLSTLKRLHRVTLEYCHGSIDLSVLRDLPELVEVRLTNCKNLTNLSALRWLPNIQSLSLVGVDDFTTDLLESMHLKRFQWYGSCYPYPDLRVLEQQTSLRYLSLAKCDGLTSLDGLGKAQLLEELCLHGGAIENLTIPPCPFLKALELHSGMLKRVRDLQNAPNLARLHFSDAAIETLDLPPLPYLTEISLRHCTRLTSISGLQNVPCLTCLNLLNSGIEALDVSPLPHLTELNLTYCKRLVSLTGLHYAPNLQMLFLTGTQIADLSELEHCLCLQKVTLPEAFQHSSDPVIGLLRRRRVKLEFHLD